jgi:hypothetical protein
MKSTFKIYFREICYEDVRWIKLTLILSNGKNLYQQRSVLEFYYKRVTLSYNNLHHVTFMQCNYLYPYPISLAFISNNVFITLEQIQAKEHNVGHW